MKAYVILAALLLPLGAANAAPAPAPLCPMVKKVVAAASETPTFQSVSRTVGADVEGVLVPAHMVGCIVSRYTDARMGATYACVGSNLKTADGAKAALTSMHTELATCLGGAGKAPGIMNLRGEGHLDYLVQSGSRSVLVSAYSRGASVGLSMEVVK